MRARFVALELVEPTLRFVAKVEHLGERLAVLAPELTADAAGGRTCSSGPDRRRRSRSRAAAHARRRRARPATLAGAPPGSANGRRSARAAIRADRVEARPVSSAWNACGKAWRDVRPPVRRSASSASRATSSPGSSIPASSISSIWKRRRSSSRARARSSPPSAASSSSMARELVAAPRKVCERVERGVAGVAIERAPLHCGRKQRLVDRSGRADRRGGRRSPRAHRCASRPST